jgi:hypothetical protein
MKSMGVEVLTVKFLGMDKGKVQLSRKAVLDDKYGKGPRSDDMSSDPPAAMSDDEIDIIAQAIAAVKDI